MTYQVVIDRVCRMRLEEHEIKESLVHQEQRYYFCSVGCRAEFERHPEDYAENGSEGDETRKYV